MNRNLVSAEPQSLRRLTPVRLSVKRALDVFVVCISAPLTVPIGLVVALLVKMRLGSPVIFTQRRTGFGGQAFALYKFRTMKDELDSSGSLLPDAERLTPFGAKLRTTSLDELPELWNVLRGDMSLVGPRPLLLRYEPFYRGREHLRHQVRPGVTGLAQVSGRNTVRWDDRLALDADYVESFSLRQDFRIILRTIRIVLFSEGVVVDPGAEMLNLDEERKGASEH